MRLLLGRDAVSPILALALPLNSVGYSDVTITAVAGTTTRSKQSYTAAAALCVVPVDVSIYDRFSSRIFQSSVYASSPRSTKDPQLMRLSPPRIQ